MLSTDAQGAEILMILVTDDKADIHRLKDDMRKSRYTYQLRGIAARRGLLDAVQNHIARNKREKPIVLVIDYRLARTACEGLLRLCSQLSAVTAIESLVTNVPADEKIQRKLRMLGANLHKAPMAGERPLQDKNRLTLH